MECPPSEAFGRRGGWVRGCNRKTESRRNGSPKRDGRNGGEALRGCHEAPGSIEEASVAGGGGWGPGPDVISENSNEKGMPKEPEEGA